MIESKPFALRKESETIHPRKEIAMIDPSVPSREPALPARSEQRLPLDAIFAPRAVAVIGATEKPGSVGRAILRNLISNPFGGTVYPVNPHRPNVLGIRAYPRIADVPESVDLAVVVTPADGARCGPRVWEVASRGQSSSRPVQGNRPSRGGSRESGSGGGARADARSGPTVWASCARDWDSTPRSPPRSPGQGLSAS